MAFDSFVMAAVCAELQTALIGARVNKIHQPDATTIVLRYHGEQGRGALLLSAHAQNGRLHLTDALPDNPAKAPLFAMVLRKWLDGARIVNVDCTDAERVATLHFDARDELGDIRRLRLVVEIMGKHSNIILVDDQERIIDGIRRYGSNLSRYREVLPGRPYLPPPPLAKLPLPPASAQELAAALYAEDEATLSHALGKRVSGLSPLLAQELALQAQLSPDADVSQLGAIDIDALYTGLSELRRCLREQDFVPTLRSENGLYTDFAALAPHSWAQKQTYDSMNQAIDLLYGQKRARQELEAARRSLLKSITHHSSRLNKKIALQEGELSRSEAADEYKEAGDLLAANIYHLRKGLEQAELADFADPQRLITVKLNPALTPQENVQNYYRRYSKAKNARGRIAAQLQSSRDEYDYLLSLEQAIADSASPAELDEIRREAAAGKYLPAPPPANGRKSAADKQAPLPPRQFISCDGFTVLIGRNNRQNDRLSLKTAAPDDLWLHTQKIPGSHVIIVSEKRDVPDSTIRQAAAWAAWYSKAKSSSQVPVDMTLVAKLVKPNGSRPGFVTYSGQRTLYVTPADPGPETNAE